ncbi:glycosyltransferase family 4 protein [Butyrivibrio sp.]|uniref:glycosyltransferase family 4 protein n=1 Tax=Butyrivibrio sp. TaxID=28121 RepID=UPI002ED5ADF4
MEYIQAFLFTSKYILGRSGNTDIFYLFSAFALLFYAWKRHDKLAYILKLLVPFIVLTFIMAYLYPWTWVNRSFIFLAKMALNVTLMVFVAYNCRRWKMFRFVGTIVWIHGMETVVALLFRDSALWAPEEFVDGIVAASRLRLFYINAGALAFASGLVLVMLVYQIMTEEVFWKQAVGAVVMIIDLYLSYGIGGITCAFIAIFSMLCVGYVHKAKKGDNRVLKRYKNASLFMAVVTVVALLLNQTYLGRIRGIVSGTDSLVNQKIVIPIAKLGHVLDETYFLGVGFGNGNTPFALNLIDSDIAFPNSFLRIIAEGGIFGILLVLICVFGLGFFCFKHGNNIDKALFIYITIYQMTGGYFTDPTNFFIYGWILGDCFYNIVDATGSCPIKLFIPAHKDKFKIAMIGHKRIPSREGGVEIVVEELSTRMVKMGHEVDAYNRSGHHVSGNEFNLADYDNLKSYEGVGIVRIPTIQKKGIAALVYSFIASIVVSFKNYDVIHYHAEGPCAFMWIPSLFGIKTVATIHGLDWARNGKWGSMASSFIKFGEKVAVEFSDSMIVLSRHVQQYFLENYNRETNLIPNGVERPERKAADIITSKYGLKGDDYILSLSRLTREKRIDLIIDAFKELDTEKKLVIAGGSSDSSEYVESLKKLASDDDRIIFTGFVQGDEMAELYSNAYLYCLPSELEGMPLSLLEAMSYGNCCLVSDIAENVDVVRDKGVSFRTNDEEDLVRKLSELINNREVVDKCKAQAADYVCGKYNWDDIAKETVGLYL